MKLFDTPKVGGALTPDAESDTPPTEVVRTAAELDAARFDVAHHTGVNRAERRRLARAGKYVPRVVNTTLEKKA